MVLIIFPAAFLLLFIMWYIREIFREKRKEKHKITKRPENARVEKAPKMTKQEFIDTYCSYCGSQMCAGLGSIYACGCKYLANIDVED